MTRCGCPFCGSTVTEVKMPLEGSFHVVCHDCGARGPKQYSLMRAEREWDRRVIPWGMQVPALSLWERLFGKGDPWTK